MSQTHHSHEVHIMPLRIYIGVWLALMFGTFLTVFVAFFDLGPVNVPLMLAIAIGKASLVGLFFMHLLYDERFNVIVFLAGLAFVIVFFAFTLVDPLTRGHVNEIEREPLAAEMAGGLATGGSAAAGDHATTGTADHATTGTSDQATTGSAGHATADVGAHAASGDGSTTPGGH